MNAPAASSVTSPPFYRRPTYWAIASLVLAALLLAAYRLALTELRSRVLTVLGPQSEVGELRLSLTAIEIIGLSIRAPAGWPTKETLRAERVVIVPQLRSLVSGAIRISSITVEGANLTVLRAANGKLRWLPHLTEKSTGAAGKSGADKSGSDRAGGPRVVLQSVVFTRSSLTLFDASVATPPHALRFDAVEARVADIHLPELKGRSEIALTASVKGPSRDGKLSLNGKMEFSSKDGEIRVAVRGVEVTALEPYLLKAAEAGVRNGNLDLDLAAVMANQRINAPGKLTLADLQLKPGSSTAATFMGMPRDAVIDLLRQRDGRIEVPFRIEGNLNDPAFSLDAAFKARLAIAAAATLGVTLKGLIGELGGLKEKAPGADRIDAAVDAIKRVLGKGK